MLKALELVGFKSFADKTRFEFPPGITVVVGPNGSGKSNIVDAIKWVLGEQSAKSLRGQDMADVIFKGAGTGGRKPANTAEATIIIDNSQGRLPIDAPEVHVTRRVYRGGEGEYLINRQPSRLKDIRDLFRGTGVGTDAYSLIEQGKVDKLLQASSKDRRAIFEEAAGISRFKAKKIEAQRRLERVEQNLLRLSDIVEEVDNRLRSVRAQAAKARRYKEYSDRLQQLRTQVGLVDWRRLTQRLAEIETELARLREEGETASARIEAAEARALELEVETGGVEESLRANESRLVRTRERIAQREAACEHQRTRCHDLDDETRRRREQLIAMCTKAEDAQGRLRDTTSAVTEAETEYREIAARLAGHEEAQSQSSRELAELRSRTESRRAVFVEQTRVVAALGTQVTGLEALLAAAQEASLRGQARLSELQSECASQAQELEQLRLSEANLGEQAAQAASAHAAAQSQLAASRHALESRRSALAELQQRRSGAQERTAVLAELAANLEGLDAGVKEVLAKAQRADSNPFSDVRGLVADLVQASVELAPLVDVALGETAQHVAVEGDRLLAYVQSADFRVAGRVGFVWINGWDNLPTEATPELVNQPGVIGRADQLVETGPEYVPLIHRLLGRTWFVETLADAVSLEQRVGRGERFVTRAGELLETDGTLLVGPRRLSEGLVSRQSELRALRFQVAQLDEQIAHLEQDVVALQARVDGEERRERELAVAQSQASDALADERLRTRTCQERHEHAERQVIAVKTELAASERRQAEITAELTLARGKLQTAADELSQLQTEVREAETRIGNVDAERQEHGRLANAARVEAAKSEQRLEGLRTRRLQFEEDSRERSRAILDCQTQAAENVSRREQAELEILQASAELAGLYLELESLVADSATQTRLREELLAERSGHLGDAKGQARRLRKLEEEQHAHDLAAGEVRHERTTLADRLREDYGIELAAATHDENPDEAQERQQVEEEIASLRRKINSVGAINMEALAELEELETRHGTLAAQFKDLSEAKAALERIIAKINTDSRRLFTETLEAIRVNFQGLYRKAFGGGKADLVLEQGVDVLDAGVEIIATPPGKPQFSNSLLSGGEKALTAVALLLAIFQFRPSPFCVLDEVDAPFDEANVGRFIEVLKDFLGWTKFVIVTHSKKTMTAATTLYGVTMQESGVSKRVSVRFDDVSDDGRISREALEREAAEDAA